MCTSTSKVEVHYGVVEGGNELKRIAINFQPLFSQSENIILQVDNLLKRKR